MGRAAPLVRWPVSRTVVNFSGLSFSTQVPSDAATTRYQHHQTPDTASETSDSGSEGLINSRDDGWVSAHSDDTECPAGRLLC